MIKCSACGKKIDNVPTWLNQVSANFVCNNCPNRDLRSIAELKVEEITGIKPKEPEMAAEMGPAEEDEE